MARARNIKPGLVKNEDLAECSVWARLCFALLPMLADREGRLEDRPKKIKGELFAFDAIEVEPLLVELERWGFIARYVVDGLPLIQIVAFKKHQNPHHREPESKLPPHPSLRLGEDGKYIKPQAEDPLHGAKASGKPRASPGLSPTRDDLARGQSRADSGFLIPDSGSRSPDTGDTAPTGAGAASAPPSPPALPTSPAPAPLALVVPPAPSEPLSPASPTPPADKAERGKRLPQDWVLPKSWGDWALAKYPYWTADIVREIALKFRNHWTAVTGKDATKLDWERTWQNWCMSGITQKEHPPPRPASAGAAPVTSTAERNAKAKALLFGDSDPRDPGNAGGEVFDA